MKMTPYLELLPTIVKLQVTINIKSKINLDLGPDPKSITVDRHQSIIKIKKEDIKAQKNLIL